MKVNLSVLRVFIDIFRTLLNIERQIKALPFNIPFSEWDKVKVIEISTDAYENLKSIEKNVLHVCEFINPEFNFAFKIQRHLKSMDEFLEDCLGKVIPVAQDYWLSEGSGITAEEEAARNLTEEGGRKGISNLSFAVFEMREAIDVISDYVISRSQRRLP